MASYRYIRILDTLNLDIFCTDIGSLSRRIRAFLHCFRQGQVFDLDIRIFFRIEAIGQLIFLEVHADLDCPFCRLYFYFLLRYIAVFIFFFHRIDEGHIVQKGILVGVLFFCIRIRRCCGVVVQSVHVRIVVVIRAVLCNRGHAEFCIIRNRFCVIERRSYAYQIILIGIFSLRRVLAGFVDLLRCGEILVFLLRR